jgi:hypothetical protein
MAAAAIHLATTTLSSQLRRQVWQGNELAEADSRVISSGDAGSTAARTGLVGRRPDGIID